MDALFVSSKWDVLRTTVFFASTQKPVSNRGNTPRGTNTRLRFGNNTCSLLYTVSVTAKSLLSPKFS
jgi:hypothetical protein